MVRHRFAHSESLCKLRNVLHTQNRSTQSESWQSYMLKYQKHANRKSKTMPALHFQLKKIVLHVERCSSQSYSLWARGNRYTCIELSMLSFTCSYTLELLHAIALLWALACWPVLQAPCLLPSKLCGADHAMQAIACIPKRNYQAAGLQLAGSATM